MQEIRLLWIKKCNTILLLPQYQSLNPGNEDGTWPETDSLSGILIIFPLQNSKKVDILVK